VDSAIGSHELCPALIARGLPASISQLTFADFAFDGGGPAGSMSIGIERKNISDLLNSLHTGRLSGHQLPGLVSTYDAVWLFVEGSTRPGITGHLEYFDEKARRWYSAISGHHSMQYTDFLAYLTSIETCTKLKVRRTESAEDTVTHIESLYRWWQKPWRDHKSFQGFHSVMPTHVELTPPSFMRRVVKEIRGIGWERSYQVERAFGNVLTMCMAEPGEWMQIDGIGKKLARNAVAQLRGEVD